jgi:5-methylcytosine-specific restriction endonuclease McrA
VADRRYKTARWQKTRAYVIARDGRCLLNRSSRCNGLPQTAHHTKPTSQFPAYFFDTRFIVAACKPCNFSDGSRIAAQNTQATIEQLYDLVVEQDQRSTQRVAQVMAYEEAERTRRTPAVH